MNFNKQMFYLAGLPRSGSTVLCNILASHPEIEATASSSLAHIIKGIRYNVSDDVFFLAQLENDHNLMHEKLKCAMLAFMNAWHKDVEKKYVVDKNRGWLNLVTTLECLDPEYKMIVTLRDPRDILASVEKQHKKTPLFEFADHLDPDIVDSRASALFDNNGVIGAPLRAIYNLGDIPNVMDHMFFVRFEDLLVEPKAVMDNLLSWLEIGSFDFDFTNIKQVTHESDSFYRYKWPHTVSSTLNKPDTDRSALVSPRIAQAILDRYGWFYHSYYKDLLDTEVGANINIEEQNPDRKQVTYQDQDPDNSIGEALSQILKDDNKEKSQFV